MLFLLSKSFTTKMYITHRLRHSVKKLLINYGFTLYNNH